MTYSARTTEPGAVHYNGRAAATVATSDRSWRVCVDEETVASLAIGALPGTWRAISPDHPGHITVGASPQCALDELAKKIRDQRRTEAARSRRTPSQNEARDLCALLHITPRTCRWRAADRLEEANTHEQLAATIEALVADGQPCALAGPIRAYREHIEGCNDYLSDHVRSLRPWHLAQLLAEMAAAGVTDAETGAQWLESVLRPRLGLLSRLLQ